MRERYLAIVVPAGARDRLEPRLAQIAAALEQRFGMVRVFDVDALVVYAAQETPILPIQGGAGVVIGALFHRGGEADPVRASDLVLSSQVTESRGESLLQSVWGGYIALLADHAHNRVDAVRDPSGAMACFRLAWEGCQVLFSDLEPILALALIKPEVDPAFIAHYLLFRGLRGARTGLCGVSELVAGTRLTIEGGRTSIATVWSPWTFADRGAQLHDRGAATAGVREEAERCVRAWARQSPAILLELSGGLDSSIIAASLHGRSGVSCVNLATDDPAADERAYAEAMARSIGASLTTRKLDIDAVEIARAPTLTWLRPGLGALQQAVDLAFIAEARDRRPDALFSGGGGDNVFCYLGSAAPATDALLTRGPGLTFLRAVDDLSNLHRCTLWRAAGLALRKWARGRPPVWRKDPRFLSSNTLRYDPAPHPWLERPTDALPGKIEHVTSLMFIQCAVDSQDRAGLAPLRYPLLSQPLVEHCLRIPSWMWIQGGRNRAVARDAFADRLPPEVLTRRSKGDFSGFSGLAFVRNRRQLADLLIGGELDRMGLLDRPAVEAYLAQTGPPPDVNFYRLLEMAGAEAWIKSWRGRDARAEPLSPFSPTVSADLGRP
ncbi:MAG: asparagine synthase C-terminal domain-containing protein [Caulobacteraceae bacterium]|nr:asparagine synthase C-terminal domain-containing protein [Caulobacteraceae bacterium]